MKNFRTLIVALVVVISAALLVAPTFAQDNPPATPSAGNNSAQLTTRTITITQEQINTRLQNRPGERLTNLSVVLGANQITVSFTTKGEKNGGVGKAIVAVVTPTVVDGKLDWTLNSLTIDGTAATQDQMAKFKDRVTNLIGGSKLAQRERRFTVTSVTVDSSAITIALTRTKSA